MAPTISDPMSNVSTLQWLNRQFHQIAHLHGMF
jgi:hypothetical protein